MSDPALDSPLIVSAHGFTLHVAPEAGAAVTRLDWQGPGPTVAAGARPLLHSPRGARAGTSEPNRFGLWPMLPFANRAFDGIIDDGEERFAVPINDPQGASTIHGFGWQHAWTVTERGVDHVTLVHERGEGADPYRYRAQLTIRLANDHVRFALDMTNTATRALPFGSGLHPWFPAALDTVVTLLGHAGVAFAPGYRALGETAWTDGGPYAGGRTRLVDAETVESVLGWRGAARFASRALGLEITVDASGNWRHPVLWSPPGADFVCFEPQSHCIGAPGHAVARQLTPLVKLEPGQSLRGWMTLSPKAI